MPVETIRSEGQAGDGSPQDYSRYRTLSGPVRMRLGDVSIRGGRRWADPAKFYVELVDSAGRAHAAGWVYKNWGVDGSWHTLGHIAGSKSLRMRVRATVVTYSWQTDYEFNTWRGELSWG